ncbi:MAG: hypothetical protein ACLP0J_29555 [Solirubrobacteraceae bacterium]|jgi:hypothetical protein
MFVMSLPAKLQLKSGSTIAVLGVPETVELELPEHAHATAEPASADAVIAFAIDSAALDTVAAHAITAAREDRLAWIAYPKAGKLGTDLNRDILARLAGERGIQPVRQIAINETWSALRFRPAV